MSTFDKVKKIIVEQLGVDESEVTLEASITDDLGADSLDQVERHRFIERELKIAFWPGVACDGLLNGLVAGDR